MQSDSRLLLLAFNCRNRFRSDAAWEECGDAYCLQLRSILRHTHSCPLKVLGGCKECLEFGNKLCCHANSCEEPMGKCVVSNCDCIRQQLRKHGLPERSSWTYQLDQLFFGQNPPPSPASSDMLSEPLCPFSTDKSADQEYTAEHAQPVTCLAQNSRPATEASCSHQNSGQFEREGAMFTGLSQSTPKVSQEWNQYHMDRPPDYSGGNVPRGPAVISDSKSEAHGNQATMPEKPSFQHASHAQWEQVLWPLNEV